MRITPAPVPAGSPALPPSPSGSAAVGVIGAGRVGAVLGAILADTPGYALAAVSGETPETRERIAVLLPGAQIRKPTDVARAADLLLLTVPDDRLAGVVCSLAGSGAIREGQYVVHTSGKHGLDVLRPAADLGAHVLALHPAMTFTGTAVDRERLQGCVFGVTATPADLAYAERLVAVLGGRPVRVAEDQRALYHAGLAHGANHLVTLVAQAMDMLAASGVADPSGTLRPLLTAALDNALTDGDAALTGPVARGDRRTVRDHLAQITEHTPGSLDSYVAMARATVDRSAADGRLAGGRAAALHETLSEALPEAPGHPVAPADDVAVDSERTSL